MLHVHGLFIVRNLHQCYDFVREVKGKPPDLEKEELLPHIFEEVLLVKFKNLYNTFCFVVCSFGILQQCFYFGLDLDFVVF